jgi:hypothetical protein
MRAVCWFVLLPVLDFHVVNQGMQLCKLFILHVKKGSEGFFFWFSGYFNAVLHIKRE